MASKNLVLIESEDVVAALGRVEGLQSDFWHHIGDLEVSRLPEQTAADLVQELSHERSGSLVPARVEAGSIYVVPMLPALRDPKVDPGAVVDDFARLGELLAAAGASLVIVGVSTYQADDNVHDFTRNDDTFAVRANRLTANLQRLCADRDYEFVDVDRTVAEIGAAEHAPQPGRFSEVAARFVSEDLVDAVKAAAGLTEVDIPPVSVLRVPAIDARARTGRIRSWGPAEGDEASPTSPLVRIEFRVGPWRSDGDRRKSGWLRVRLQRRRMERHQRRSGMTIDIKPTGQVALARILVRAGEEVAVDQPIAVFTRDSVAPPNDTTSLPDLPTTVEMVNRRWE